MTPVQKKWFYHALRLLICVAAFWYVARGVTLEDRVWLAGAEREIIGSVASEGDALTITLGDGSTRVISRAEIALSEYGTPRIEYGVKTAWRKSDKRFLLLSLMIFLPVPVLQGVRLLWMLRAQEIHIGIWDNVKLAFAGNFLNFAAPLGATGGDVFKAYYVSLHTKHKTEAVTTIFLDRVVGLLSLILVVAVVATLAPSESPLAKFRLYTVGMLAVGVIGALAYLSPTLRARFVPYKLLERLPKIEQLRRIDKTARVLAGRRSILLIAVVITIALQGLAIISYMVIAKALGLDARLDNAAEFYAYFATGCVVQSLPGPPQGLGTVELAYRIFFAPFGSPSQIVCMALAVRVMVLTGSLPGVLVALTGAYKPRDSENASHVAPRIEAATDHSAT